MPLTRLHTSVTAALAAILVCLITSAGWAQAPADKHLITEGQVGAAVLGSTAAELEEQLGSGYDVGDEQRITVDFEGFIVTLDGEPQFRAAKADGGDKLNLFIVSNPDYKTAEGVGAGTSIEDAEAIYGAPTFSWNPDNESREFVTFENQPEGRIAFRTPGIGGNNIGIYDDDVFETTEYDPAGVIAAIWVSCLPGKDCPADTDDGATDDGATDDGATDDGATDDGATDDGATDDGATDDGATDDGATDDGATDDGLADTGVDENLLLTVVAGLMATGGALVRIERHYELGPAWLRGRTGS